MNQKVKNYQRDFFDRLSEKVPVKKDMIADVGEVIGVGKDAVYRRLRGDTELTANEMVQLAHSFSIELDTLGNERAASSPVMSYAQTRNDIRSDLDYFKCLRGDMDEIVKLPGVQLDYSAAEIPFYYLMLTPVLRSFKIFMYGVTTWNLDKWAGEKFSTKLISPATHEEVDQTVRSAFTIPVRELWSSGMLDTTLRQINYMFQTGRFTHQQDVQALFKELHGMVDHLQKMVEVGKRYHPQDNPSKDHPRYQVYHNELANTNNVMLARSANHSLVYNDFIPPNYVSTTDRRIYEDVADWLDELIENSTVLGNETKRTTLGYFDRLRQRIDALRERIRIARETNDYSLGDLGAF